MVDLVARIRISLVGVERNVWRRIEIPVSKSLSMLHVAIQAAMLFECTGQFWFEIGRDCYGQPSGPGVDPPRRGTASIFISDVVRRDVSKFTYTYASPAAWVHEMTIEDCFPEPGRRHASFVDGAGRAPPETLGGADCFERYLRRPWLTLDGIPFADQISEVQIRNRLSMATRMTQMLGPNDLDVQA